MADPAGHIQGTVTIQGGGVLDGIQVVVCTQGPWGGWMEQWPPADTTAGGGFYDLTLPPGTYRLRFVDPTNTYGYQYWPDQNSVIHAESMTITAAGETNYADEDMPPGGTIFGTAVAAGTGDLLDGIRVTVIANVPGWWPGVAAATTDVSGYYEVGGLPPGGYLVRFDDYDHLNPSTYASELYSDQSVWQYDTAAVVVPAPWDSGVANALLGLDSSISGHVTGGGADLGSAQVQVNVQVPGPDGPQLREISRVSADPGGNYAVDGLPPGTYYLRFEDTSGMYVSESWEDHVGNWSQPDPIVLGYDDHLGGYNADLALSGYITGNVSGSGFGALSGMNVAACIDRGGWLEQVAWAQTDEFGGYTLSGLVEGSYVVEFQGNSDWLNQYYSETSPGTRDWNDSTPVDVLAGATSFGISGTLDPASHVVGLVSDQSLNYIAGIRVVPMRWQVDGTGGGWWERMDWMAAVTSGTGRYEIGGLEEGDYGLFFDAGTTGWASEYWNNSPNPTGADVFHLGYDTTLEGMHAALDLAGRISGTVSGSGSASLEGLRVVAVDPFTWEDIGSAQTDPAGEYTIYGLPAGTYEVRVDQSSNWLQGWWDGDLVPVIAGDETTSINIMLLPACKITGYVTPEGGGNFGYDGAVNAVIVEKVFDDPGNPEQFHWEERWENPGGVTLPDGYYQIGGLSPGMYRVVFKSDSGDWAAEYWNDQILPDYAADIPLDTPGDIATNINAELAPAASISGRVTSDGVTGIPNITVGAGPVDETDNYEHIAWTRTDNDGYYQLSGLPAATYVVQFWDDNGTYLSETYDDRAEWWMADRITVHAGWSIGGINAVLTEGAHISGTVWGEGEAEGLAGIGVTLFEESDDGQWGRFVSQTTGPGGTYDFGGLQHGRNYRLWFDDPADIWGAEGYLNASSVLWADSIQAPQTGADVELGTAGGISGVVYGGPDESTPLNPAMIHGGPFNPVTGQWDSGLIYAETNASGEYTLTGLKPGILYRIWAEDGTGTYAPGFWADGGVNYATAENITFAGGATATADFHLQAGSTIAGRVTNGSGNGIPGVFVEFYVSAGQWGWQPYEFMLAQVTTDANGYYTAPGMVPGTYRVRFSTENPAYAGECYDNVLFLDAGTDVVIQSYGQLKDGINATLSDAAAIEGIVTNDVGQPIAGASVSAVVARNNQGWWQDLDNGYAETDENGYYRIDGLRPEDEIFVHAWSNNGNWLEGWYDDARSYEEATGVFAPAGDVLSDINITLDPAAHIRGTVTGDRGFGPEGLQGIEVQIYWFNGESWDWGGSGWTDNNGYYDLGGLPDGEYRLWFVDWSGEWAAEAYKDVASWIWGTGVLTSAAVPAEVDAQLMPAGTITGTVLGDGVPLEGATVIAGPYDAGTEEWDAWAWTETDEFGNYTLTGLTPGTAYRVQADDAGGEYLRTVWTDPPASPPSDDWRTGTDVYVDAPPSPLTVCDFNLTTGCSITGFVYGSDHLPIEGAWVFLFTPTPDGWNDFWGSFQGVQAVTDEFGEYTIGGLYPGEYRVAFAPGEVSPIDYASETWDDAPTLSMGDTIEFSALGEVADNTNAWLSIAGYIEGHVYDQFGMPLGGVEVMAAMWTDPDGNWTDLDLPYVETDENGYYRIGGLRPEDEVFVHVRPQAAPFAEQWYDDAPYIWESTGLYAPEGWTLSDIDFYLERAGTIGGSITLEDPSGGYGPVGAIAYRLVDGPDGIEWQYYTEVRGEWGGVTPEGYFQLVGLPVGQYVVQFYDASGTHASEYFDDTIVSADAVPLTVTWGGLANVDAHLEIAGSITGTVTDTLGDPAPNIMVTVLAWDDMADGWVATVGEGFADGDGNYTIPMRPGTYRVRFGPTMASLQYVVQFYDGAPIEGAAKDVEVDVGSVTDMIDAVMTMPASLEVHATDTLAAPLDGIDVELWRSDGIGGWYPTTSDLTVGGTVLFEGLLPGDYWVYFHDPAGIYKDTYYDIEPDGWPNDIPLAESENGSVIQAMQLVDVIGPTTSMVPNPAVANGQNGWYISAPSITLTSSEPGSATYWFWDGDAQAPYVAPLVAPEGTNTVTYWSVDPEDNAEDPAKTATFKVDTANPSTPTGVHATALSTTSIRVSWIASTDSSSGIWCYHVYDAITDTLLATVTGGSSADIGGLTPNTAHSYYVVAQDYSGRESGASAQASATTPTGVDATPPVTQIYVFPAAADGLGGWYVSSPGVTFATGELGTTTYYYWDSAGEAQYTVPLSAPEGQHTIHYHSHDAVGNPETEQTRDFKVDTVNPTTPTGVNATALGTTSIRVSWTASSDATSGIWHYLVYNAGTNALVATVTGSSTDVTGLSPGTAYSFYVIAQDNAGRTSAESAEAGATTTGDDTTLPVTQIYFFPGAADGLDGWFLSAPSILFGTGEAGTTTYYYWDSAAESQYTVPLYAPEGQHTIHYHSHDAVGNPEVEKTLAFKVDTVNPTTPTGVTAAALGTTSIRVSWTAATDATSGIWHYLVYDAGTDAVVATVTGTSADVTGLSPGTAYSFYVVAEDLAGRDSGHSTAAGATTTGAPTTLLPVYRFYRQSTGTHFYTVDPAEMQRVRDTMSATYLFEGVCYYVNTSNPANSVPLYRLYNRKTGTHLYTADEGEKNAILANLSDTYSLDGIAYYVSMSSGLEVYRFYSPSKGVHFYSADPVEIAYVRANLGAVWQYEGLAFYVGQ